MEDERDFNTLLEFLERVPAVEGKIERAGLKMETGGLNLASTLNILWLGMSYRNLVLC